MGAKLSLSLCLSLSLSHTHTHITGETNVDFLEPLLSGGGIKNRVKKSTLCGAW